MITKFLKYMLITIIPAGLSLSVILISSIFSNSKSIQKQHVTTTLNPLADTGDQIDSIDFRNVIKTNWTWPDDKSGAFPYNFSSQDRNWNTIAQFNATGFNVNNAFPKYSIKNWRHPINGYGMTFQIYTANLIVSAQKYNATTKIIANPNVTTTHAMTYGNTDNDTFKNLSNYSLNFELPYLKFKIPVIDQKVRYTTGVNNNCVFGGHYDTYNGKDMLNGYDNWQTINPSIIDPVHQDQAGYGPAQSNIHMHSEFAHHEANISLYNDYDLDGTKIHNYMFFKEINSSLPIMSIDETKLNKNIHPSLQNTDISGLIRLSNAQHIPSFTQPTVTVTKNNTNGKVTFNYRPKATFLNGVLQQYTGNGVTTIISGFPTLKTNISSRAVYPSNIVVDRFLKSIKNAGIVNAEELGKYLDLNSVPPGATYTILENANIDLVKGTIKFKINASIGYGDDGSLNNTPTPDFEISLQLTPRITKMSYTEILDNISVSEYYNKVFDKNGLINLDVFNKYTNIIAPVDGAQYYLVSNSYKINTGDGNVDFKLYATKYHGLNAQEINGSENTPSTHFDINLILNPLPSSVVVKTLYTPAHRTDMFINLLANTTTGVIKDLELLKQYVDFKNIPSTADISIDPASISYDQFNDDFYYEYVNFDLIVSRYNETNQTLSLAKTIPLRIKLNSVHLQTRITAKLPFEYDSTVRLDRLLPKIINKQGLVVNRNLLEQYVNIEALPSASVLSIDNAQMNNQLGILKFDLSTSIAYDNDSNKLVDFSYPIELQLGIKYHPTLITAIADPINPERVDRFVQQLELFDSDSLKNYLIPKYIQIDGDFPIAENMINLSVTDLIYQDEGLVNFNLILNFAYDNNSDPQVNYSFPLSLHLGKKFASTSISLLSHYPQGSTVGEFKQLYEKYKDDQIELVVFLNRFLKGINTIPINAITNLNIIDDKTDEMTGKLTFNLQASTYYDVNSDLVNDINHPYVSSELQIDLIPKNQQTTLSTTINWKNDVFISGQASDFYNKINPNNKVDYVELSNHLVLSNIPLDATINIINNDPEFKNPMFLHFDVVLTYWWETGTLKPENDDAVQKKHISLQKNLFIFNVNGESINFQWWWIAMSIGGVILLITSLFLIKQYNIDKKFKQLALGQE